MKPLCRRRPHDDPFEALATASDRPLAPNERNPRCDLVIPGECRLPAVLLRLRWLRSQLRFTPSVVRSSPWTRSAPASPSRWGASYCIAATSVGSLASNCLEFIPTRLGNRCSIRLSYGVVPRDDSVVRSARESCQGCSPRWCGCCLKRATWTSPPALQTSASQARAVNRSGARDARASAGSQRSWRKP
jgi:hypothetical protein